MHLVDHARAHIEETYTRPLLDRLMRALLAACAAISAHGFARRWWRACSASRSRRCWPRSGLKPFAALLRLAPLPRAAAPMTEPGVYRGEGRARAGWRCCTGCANEALAPSITAADHPPAQPPRHRGGGRRGRRLLRLARSPHGPRAGGRLRQGARQYRCLDARDRRRGTRRHRHHHLRLRHHGEGLRLHAAHRSGLCGERRRRSRAWPATSREYLATLGLAPRRDAGRPDRGLPLRLLAAARPAGRSGTEGVACRLVASW